MRIAVWWVIFVVVCTMLVVQPVQGNRMLVVQPVPPGNRMTVEGSASIDGALTAGLNIEMPPLQDNKQAIESSPSSSSHFPPQVKPTSLESKFRGQGHHSSLAKGESAKDLHH